MTDTKVEKELSDVIKNNLRKYKEPNYYDVPIEFIQYAAGFSDTDGCFQVCHNTPIFYIGQAEKGINALHFMYEKFGGTIYLHKEGNEKHQTSYDWKLSGSDAIEYAKLVLPDLLIKKREAQVFVNYVVGKFMFLFNAINKQTGEILEFNTGVDCACHFSIDKLFVQQKTQKDKTITYENWEIKRKYGEDEINEIHEKRRDIEQKLKSYKTTPHDEIAEDIIPSIPWRAGVIDGEGSLNVNGTFGQHHSITQKYKPLLELFKRLYGGGVHYRKGSDTYAWEVNREAYRLLREVAPYLQGKKKQADLILNMKPGEAPQVHVKLRELKGNCTAPTPSVDAIKNGAPGIKASQTKPHKPPRTLPKGLLMLPSKTIQVKIQHNKKKYSLGLFELKDIKEAEALYQKYADAISLEKRGGAKADFTNIPFITRK
jgi:hypothetical protein